MLIVVKFHQCVNETNDQLYTAVPFRVIIWHVVKLSPRKKTFETMSNRCKAIERNQF